MNNFFPGPTVSQQAALNSIARFLEQQIPIFLLRGSAGTGKTTMITNIVKLLIEKKRPFQLLAPTGRAARILGARTHCGARTIHGYIYAVPDINVIESAESPNDPGLHWFFPLKHDDPLQKVFIVDEASMVGDKESKGDLLQFGSGRLLADLIEFSRLGRLGRPPEFGPQIIFVGDWAQLPPVGETLSPALSAKYLRDVFRLECDEFELTEVVRQQAGSAVLDRATVLRDAIGNKLFNSFNVAAAEGEIVLSSISDGVATAEASFRSKSSAVFITSSNAQALKLNRAVRGRLWGAEDADVQSGDLLLINKNSFKCELSNGDLV